MKKCYEIREKTRRGLEVAPRVVEAFNKIVFSVLTNFM